MLNITRTVIELKTLSVRAEDKKAACTVVMVSGVSSDDLSVKVSALSYVDFRV